MEIIDIIWDLPAKLARLSQTLQTFIFSSITVGDYTVSFWGLLGGVLLVALIIGGLVGAIRG